MTNLVEKKPEGSQWTDEQWQAIVTSGKDVLVAAAAGSGKTAVLVERLIHKITHPEHPVDVDRLLVVTFTNAAAAEMRARIGQALEKALSESPESEFLRHQILLLNRASIMTFHAFCMSVVKRYYYLLDLDPAFRTVEETEAELLREEVMEELLEHYYSQEDNKDFYNLVDSYSNDRNDSYLQSLIMKLYDFSRSHPYPDQWLETMKNAYQIQPTATVDDLSWTGELKKHLRHRLKGMLPLLNHAEHLCDEVNGPKPYKENIQEDIALINDLIEATYESWERLSQAFSDQSFSKLKRVGKETDEDLKEQVKSIRDSVKKQIGKIMDESFARTPNEQLEDIKEMSPHVELLVELVQAFADRYQAVKREKALVDFSDLEHFCLTILNEEDEGNPTPSQIALNYRDQFVELLVDEYQDTNLVQETIIQLISADQETGHGNLFMVGDVKQSIYRFRLAEPSLFLEKYKEFGLGKQGIKIDLASNFRSREEVIHGTNFIFKQIMDEAVGEIDYDEAAELKFGASYYPNGQSPSELIVINRGSSNDEEKNEDEEDSTSDLLTAELEAVQMAKRIKALVGEEPDESFQVYDKELKRNRPIQYRDIVILLRAVQGWAPVMMDVFKQYGIPVHAELSRGYFEATEVAVMLSLLKVIDNPYQDIPLASVLRSPIVGLSGEELANIRLAEPKDHYYVALKNYIQQHRDDLSLKLIEFVEQLNSWRDLAHQGALADLIWQIYRDTGYYDYVLGTSGGNQRQANLKALYDRARQYESTSFRGLFRFLRFIERIQDKGNDLGEARALGEQEDVVRMMTIHKSKGLEYPVVFVAGLNKQFNRQDIYRHTLLHKSLGFATKRIDSAQRVMYPTLPFTATKQKLEMELLAEEMRVLYVALTRAREKLILVATSRDLEKQSQKWITAVLTDQWLIQDEARFQAKTYFDWIAPSLFRHQEATVFHDLLMRNDAPSFIASHPSSWEITVVPSRDLIVQDMSDTSDRAETLEKIKHQQTLAYTSDKEPEIHNRLMWEYPYQQATQFMTKQTVTEIKRQQERQNEGFDTVYLRQFRGPIVERPKFLQDDTLLANERGTAMHMMMQHIELNKPINEKTLMEKLHEMRANELFTDAQVDAIDIPKILDFFTTDIGQKLLNSDQVERELPFSVMLKASEAYSDWHGSEEEMVLVQGVIDCVIETKEGLILLDYKTDAISLRFESLEDAKIKMANKYRTQLNLYKTAIERIWRKPVRERLLYFFDSGLLIKL